MLLAYVCYSSKFNKSLMPRLVRRRWGGDRFGAHFIHLISRDFPARISPTIQYISQDIGDFVIIELIHGRHHRVVFFAINSKLAGQTM